MTVHHISAEILIPSCLFHLFCILCPRVLFWSLSKNPNERTLDFEDELVKRCHDTDPHLMDQFHCGKIVF